MKIILVIGDRPEQAKALAERLGIFGIEAIPCARDWKLAVRCLTSHQVSLILLSVDKSQKSSEFFSTLQELTEVPITAFGMGTDADHVVWYLENGSADYIPANTPINVLAAKLSSQLRTGPQAPAPARGVINLRDLSIDLDAYVVTRSRRVVSLTPLEFKLLRVLAENAGRACSRKMLLEQVWGEDFQSCAHYLRLYIGYLRQKLEVDPARPRLLLTEWGYGYRLVKPRQVERRVTALRPQLRNASIS